MENKTVRVAVYCRVAREDEHEAAIQEARMLRLATELGYDVSETYIDNGFSGLNLDRPAMGRMESAICAGLVDAALVRDISRIGRNYLLVSQWLEWAESQGVKIITAEQPADCGLDDTIRKAVESYRRSAKPKSSPSAMQM